MGSGHCWRPRRRIQARPVAPANRALPHRFPRLSRPFAGHRNLPDKASPVYVSFVQELYADLHSRNLRLYVSTLVSTTDEDLKHIAASSTALS